MPIVKAIQLNGISVDKKVDFVLNLKQFDEIETYVFMFLPYEDFIEQRYEYINRDVISPKSSSVVVYKTMGHNSLEVHYIKMFVAILCVADRISKSETKLVVQSQHILKEIQKNWNLPGYFNNIGRIVNTCLAINLGPKEIDGDSFESYLTRAYGGGLCDSYDRRCIYDKHHYSLNINVDDAFLKTVSQINAYLNEESNLSNKLKSVFRLYYDTLMEYCDMDSTVINLSTIFETLLLCKDESNQRKKVSVRAACLVCDGQNIDYKKYIANYVYNFYKYRNGIVHDGKSYLDYEEITMKNVVMNIKHIIYYIIKLIIMEPSVDIKKVVEKNTIQDGLQNGFDYIDEDNCRYELLFPD